MKALVAENLTKTYKIPGGKPLSVLRGVSLTADAGEHVAILGRSGTGKSTLLNLLGGLDSPDEGCNAKIEIYGKDMAGASEKAKARIRASEIGFVFQSFHLLPELNIEANVALPSWALHRKSRNESLSRAKLLLEAAGLGERLGHYPNELSGGEQQRVAVVRALMNSPRLILADEPTGNLDQTTGTAILDLLFDLSGRFSSAPPALVMVTHSKELAARCDRTYNLS